MLQATAMRRGLGRALSMAAVCAALAACGTTTELQRSSSSVQIGATEAFAFPPPGGPAIVGVVERRFANAIQQDIALAANSTMSGQNYLRIQLFGPVGTEAGQTELTNLPLTQNDVRRELRAEFPGMAMQISPLYVQNDYGPFGYAFGRSGRDLCLYAWQRVSARPADPVFQLRGSMQARLRLCEAGASERALLSVMYGFTIVGGFRDAGWNPFGPPAPLDSRIGTTTSPVYPSASQGFENVLTPAPEPVVLRPAARRAVVQASQPAAAAAVPVQAAPIAGPLVPPPPAGAVAPSAAAPVVPAPPVARP